ncbi:hypothetical protein Goshw_022404, partial [Gossypium schwendimanii]|nr:hypothetical protein [Gossypium schwendimanii]
LKCSSDEDKFRKEVSATSDISTPLSARFLNLVKFLASMSKPWPSNLKIKPMKALPERLRWVKLTNWLNNFDEMVPLKGFSARREPLRLLELKSSHWRL